MSYLSQVESVPGAWWTALQVLPSNWARVLSDSGFTFLAALGGDALDNVLMPIQSRMIRNLLRITYNSAFEIVKWDSDSILMASPVAGTGPAKM